MEKIRNITLCLLLPAISLIANKIIPHHHHTDEVCFATSHCESDTDQHTDAAEQENPDHDHRHNNFGTCQLEIFFLVSKNDAERKNNRAAPETLPGFSPVASGTADGPPLIYAAREMVPDDDPPDLAVKILVRAMRAPPSS